MNIIQMLIYGIPQGNDRVSVDFKRRVLFGRYRLLTKVICAICKKETNNDISKRSHNGRERGDMKGNLVTIMKDGKWINVDEDDLCHDGIMAAQAGDIVPADLQLIETAGLEADEFDLTGGLSPVLKKAQDNTMLYRGSKVIRGSGSGIVVATGEQTEHGQIAKQLWGQSETFQIRFSKKKHLILIILLLPAFVIQAVCVSNLAVLIVLYLFWAAVIVLL